LLKWFENFAKNRKPSRYPSVSDQIDCGTSIY
jgi:hypothetical protein